MALSSAGARAEYARGSLKMIAAAPLEGVGLGEYFPHYIRLRRPGAEETRQPHCMVLGYAAQAGVLAGLAALAVLGLPLFLRRLAPDAGAGLLAVVQAGTVAWGLHALADLNSEIAGSVMVFALLPLLAAAGGDHGPWSVVCGGEANGKNGAEGSKNGKTGERNTKKRKDEKTEGARLKPAMILFRAAAVLLALAALAGVWRWPGERAYAEAVQLAADGNVSTAVVAETAQAAARRLPESPYPWNFLGLRELARGDARAAQAAFAEAVARTPHRSGFWEPLSKSALLAGDLATARQAAAKAAEWNPSNPRIQDLCRRLGVAVAPP
jgi:hypothetical protein